jgi:serine/threonine-protein kinase
MARYVLPPRFVDQTLVAAGGMGEVYRATDSDLGRTVAVKLLSERHAQDAEVRERFTREARSAARLSSHPNIVTVYDVGEHAGRPYIVMQFLSGGSVHDRLRAGRVEPSRALAWLSEAALGLDAAHASGIVHRDVKPANLLLDDQDRVHVTDFGIASATGFDTLTLPGTVLGTAGYLSPEQARGEPATAASDRYGLGVVAFELLAGRRPFESDTPVTEALAHATAAVPSVRSSAPSLPPAVDAALRRALAKEPGDRPASASELVDELRAALRDSEPETLVHAAPAPTSPPSSVLPAPARSARSRFDPRWPVVLVGAAAILLAGVGTAAVLARDEGSGERTVTRVRTVVSTVSDTASTLTVTETTTGPATTATEPEPEDGAALNDAGFERMQAGDYAAALPLLERAVAALSGSGELAEAYASYNLAFTRLALGRCDDVVELLDRSEEIQGDRGEIDELRRDARRACDEDRGQGNRDDDD